MLVDGVHYRTIWLHEDARTLIIIDQTQLPYHFELVRLESLAQVCTAINTMQLRGAPLIGATAAYGIALALNESNTDKSLALARQKLLATRPTAVNLAWAIERVYNAVFTLPPELRVQRAYDCATDICNEDVGVCESIGNHGLKLINNIATSKSGPVNVLTHCNAGWLAAIDWGTALAPVYKAHQAGIPIHVWVNETRPRHQGAFLTAWELAAANIPHTVIVDNAGGHLMQRGLVDLCLVGADRATAAGDVCNKIGTYLQALAARDNQLPFYACAPSSSIDWTISNGLREIEIEQRPADEIRKVSGLVNGDKLTEVELFPKSSPVRNDAFDVTPAHLLTGLITERGVAQANRSSLTVLFPEFSQNGQSHSTIFIE